MTRLRCDGRRDQGPRRRDLQDHRAGSADRCGGQRIRRARGADCAVPVWQVADEAVLRRLSQVGLRIVPAGGAVSERGPTTRAAHARLPAPVQGEPFLPGPVLGAPFHLAGEVGDVVGYNRDGNPTWAGYEEALAELEGADVVVFASGMAAVHAALETTVRPGDVLVAPVDGYPGIRGLARDHFAPRGVEVRLVATDEAAVRDALPGATAVFLESPSNPALNVLDVAA